MFFLFFFCFFLFIFLLIFYLFIEKKNDSFFLGLDANPKKILNIEFKKKTWKEETPYKKLGNKILRNKKIKNRNNLKRNLNNLKLFWKRKKSAVKTFCYCYHFLNHKNFRHSEHLFFSQDSGEHNSTILLEKISHMRYSRIELLRRKNISLKVKKIWKVKKLKKKKNNKI